MATPLHNGVIGEYCTRFWGRRNYPQAGGTRPPVMHSVAERFPQSSPVNTIEISTHIGIHDPAHTLMHAPFASLMQCIVGAASWPKTIRAVGEVLLVDRFQQHGHRSLDHLILERRLPDRTLTSIVLLNPDTLDGRCLRAAAA